MRYFLRLAGTVPYRELVRYLIAGGSATVVHFLVLILLTEYAGVWYLASSGIAFICGVTVSFILQKWWTFSEVSTDMIPTQALYYLSVILAGLAVNASILFVLVDVLDMWYVVAQVPVSAIIAIINFFLYRSIFRKIDAVRPRHFSVNQ